MKKERIIIWGTGQKAVNVLLKFNFTKYNIVAFADNNPDKAGQLFNGVKVIDPNGLKDLQFDRIIICSVFFDEIKDELIEHYHIPSDMISNALYPDKVLLMEHYKQNEKNAEIEELLQRLQENELEMYNYDFMIPYKKMEIVVNKDVTSGLFYVIHWGKKLFFARKYDTISKVEIYYRSLISEQNQNSPHCYRIDEFEDVEGNIVVDAGVAEGNFSLEIIDQVKKIYLIETDIEWIEALKLTFEPYASKIVIINKFLSDSNDDNNITLDSLSKIEKIDYIKMDIEGAEVMALKGGINMLKNTEHIRVVACSYHNQEDEVKIENILKRNNFTTSRTKGYMYYDYNVGVLTSKTPMFRRGIVRGIK